MAGGAAAFFYTRGHMLPFLFTLIIYRSMDDLQPANEDGHASYKGDSLPPFRCSIH
jgi:hypothetical protein